jgi:hypothetical protein
LAQSRHPDRVGECPLLGVKRTSKFKSVTSAFDPKRTQELLVPVAHSYLNAADGKQQNLSRT